MHFATPFILVAAFVGIAQAELNPCLANAIGAIDDQDIPSDCQPCKSDDDVQEAECAYNTRCHHKGSNGEQTFAIFYRDTSKKNRLNVPLGTCEAYSNDCDFQPTADMVDGNPDMHTFFWLDGSGGEDGVGTDCIRDFKSGECKCENSDGSSIVNGQPFVDCF